MLAIKGFYDRKRIELLEPMPKNQVGKRSMVVITFLEDEKVPYTTKQAVMELIDGRLLELDEVLREV
jgi:hypothetical protein